MSERHRACIELSKIIEYFQDGECPQDGVVKKFLENFGDDIDLSTQLCEVVEDQCRYASDYSAIAFYTATVLDDKNLARKLFKKALEKCETTITEYPFQPSNYSEVASKIAKSLGDEKWAKEVLELALKKCDIFYKYDEIRDHVVNSIKDKELRKQLFEIIFSRCVNLYHNSKNLKITSYECAHEPLIGAFYCANMLCRISDNIDDKELENTAYGISRNIVDYAVIVSEHNNDYRHLTDFIFTTLNKDSWAKERLAKALEKSVYLYNCITIGKIIANEYDDMKWAKTVFKIALEKCIFPLNFREIGNAIENCNLHYLKWADRLYKKAAILAKNTEEIVDFFK